MEQTKLFQTHTPPNRRSEAENKLVHFGEASEEVLRRLHLASHATSESVSDSLFTHKCHQPSIPEALSSVSVSCSCPLSMENS
jgi:hypothetical protein